MNKNDAFVAAIAYFLQLKSMSREDLAHNAGGMKKDTIDKKINGDTETRSNTRKRIISGLDVDYVEFRRVENALQSGKDVSQILAPNEPVEVHQKLEDIERTVSQIADSLEGISIPVARAILSSFGARLTSWSRGQIEERFLELASEYRELKAQIRQLSSSDPKVQEQRDRALEHTERGEFDAAIECLEAARKIDQASRERLDAAYQSRSNSEAETILANARILGLKLHYATASDTALSAYSIVSKHSEELSSKSLRASLRYLTDYANDIGEADAVDDAIVRLKTNVLPLLSDGSRLALDAEYCLADLLFLKGYRQQENSWLLLAAKKFRHLARYHCDDPKSEQHLQNALRLGDAHGEMGLNRGSQRQLRLGANLMLGAINQLEEFGFESAALNGKIRYGTVRSNLALLTQDVDDYREAQAAYGASRKAAVVLGKPIAAARADWGLAITYIGEAEKTGESSLFDLAIDACNDATSTITEKKYPIDWSTIISNRANAKLERGRKANGTESLFEALSDYDIALKYRTPDRHLLGYAKSLGNKATALRLIGEREADTSMIEEAAALLRRVCKALPQSSSYWQSYYTQELNRAEAALIID